MTGKCDRGDNCDYWHVPDCHWFKKGKCSNGAKCLFRHVKGNAANATAGIDAEADKKTKPKKEPKAKAKAKGQIAIAATLLATTLIAGGLHPAASMATPIMGALNKTISFSSESLEQAEFREMFPSTYREWSKDDWFDDHESKNGRMGGTRSHSDPRKL